jgi:hypothetical protein
MSHAVVTGTQLPWRRIMTGGIIQFSVPMHSDGASDYLPCRWDKRGMGTEQIARTTNEKDNAV